eukprot:CAMPEP_0196825202 /NCGR_PEP_ID=MMETSP1362-20130617/92913_1 /TAXON_ID=163516 /ORGANISM="Leptocylindrus danicus, Strain CCMP1856" /LENGTH=234 /DNA_ID=CAMNT_0042205583 /DNA_START=630 /DNA_END=1334 /DNA_ORIENTATION=+
MASNNNTPSSSSSSTKAASVAVSSSFYKLTHSIVSSAANFMEELLDQFEFEEAAADDDDDLSSSSCCHAPRKQKNNMLLPWEAIERSGTGASNNGVHLVVSYPDLQRQILDISVHQMSCLVVHAEHCNIQKKIQVDPNKNTVNFRNHIPMLQRMMQMDRNLAVCHSKLCTRRIQEDVFWNYYLMCILECQQKFFMNAKDRDKVVVGELEEEEEKEKEEKVSMHGTKMYEDFVVV